MKVLFKHRFNFKPISANKLWYRNKTLTKQYRDHRDDMYHDVNNWTALRKRVEGVERLTLVMKCGLSSKLADLDNVCKGQIDSIQNLLDFNDKIIYRIELEKENVKRGQEYFEITLKEYKV